TRAWGNPGFPHRRSLAVTAGVCRPGGGAGYPITGGQAEAKPRAIRRSPGPPTTPALAVSTPG
ncbi:MAG: hypothetical protein M3M94_03060, partial [Actinomycetota bacterium]|nr:hypothetical protein [Actinomycetota bacterium]